MKLNDCVQMHDKTDNCLHRPSAVTEVNSPLKEYLLEEDKYLCRQIFSILLFQLNCFVETYFDFYTDILNI